MHAFCMFYLYVSLEKSRKFAPTVISENVSEKSNDRTEHTGNSWTVFNVLERVVDDRNFGAAILNDSIKSSLTTNIATQQSILLIPQIEPVKRAFNGNFMAEMYNFEPIPNLNLPEIKVENEITTSNLSFFQPEFDEPKTR